jgi:hypothetical protein
MPATGGEFPQPQPREAQDQEARQRGLMERIGTLSRKYPGFAVIGSLGFFAGSMIEKPIGSAIGMGVGAAIGYMVDRHTERVVDSMYPDRVRASVHAERQILPRKQKTLAYRRRLDKPKINNGN